MLLQLLTVNGYCRIIIIANSRYILPIKIYNLPCRCPSYIQTPKSPDTLNMYKKNRKGIKIRG